MNLFKRVVIIAALFLAPPAAAQWQTQNHSVPIGRGVGVQGFGNAAPGAAGRPLTSNGATSDPSFQQLTNSGIAPGSAHTVKGSTDGATTTDVPLPWVAVTDYAACDGAADDTANIRLAVAAASSGTLTFPAGRQCNYSGTVRICDSGTCSDGGASSGTPRIVQGNNSTLFATGANAYLLVENNNVANGLLRIRVRDLNFNANNVAPFGFFINGCLYCQFTSILSRGATIANCVFAGFPNNGFYYNVVSNVACNDSAAVATADGVHVYSYTAGGAFGGGSIGCAGALSYNNSNSFVAMVASGNRRRGFDLNCSNNLFVNPDVEANFFGAGIAISAGFVNDFIGGYAELNGCQQVGLVCTVGTPSSASGLTVNGYTRFSGGNWQGTFFDASHAVPMSSTNGYYIEVNGVAGFGSTACGGSRCMTIP